MAIVSCELNSNFGLFNIGYVGYKKYEVAILLIFTDEFKLNLIFKPKLNVNKPLILWLGFI